MFIIYYMFKYVQQAQSNKVKSTVKVNNINDMTYEPDSILNTNSINIGNGKSLYISGTLMDANNTLSLSTDNCIVGATNSPSKYPSTVSPTLNPTFKPTDYGVVIKFGVVITVTFDYKFGVNDTETILKIIEDVTSKLVNDTVTANCIESDDLNIKSVTRGDKTIVNAT